MCSGAAQAEVLPLNLDSHGSNKIKLVCRLPRGRNLMVPLCLPLQRKHVSFPSTENWSCSSRFPTWTYNVSEPVSLCNLFNSFIHEVPFLFCCDNSEDAWRLVCVELRDTYCWLGGGRGPPLVAKLKSKPPTIMHKHIDILVFNRAAKIAKLWHKTGHGALSRHSRS